MAWARSTHFHCSTGWPLSCSSVSNCCRPPKSAGPPAYERETRHQSPGPYTHTHVHTHTHTHTHTLHSQHVCRDQPTGAMVTTSPRYDWSEGVHPFNLNTHTHT